MKKKLKKKYHQANKIAEFSSSKKRRLLSVSMIAYYQVGLLKGRLMKNVVSQHGKNLSRNESRSRNTYNQNNFINYNNGITTAKRSLFDLNELEDAPFCELPEHFFEHMLQKLAKNGNQRGETTIIEISKHNHPRFLD